MKLLRKITLAAFLTIGFTLTASAQRTDEGRREKPPRDRAEIPPADKKPPRNNDNNNNNRGNENPPKKPQTYFLISENRIEITSI